MTTVQELRSLVEQKRETCLQALGAWHDYCLGVNRSGDGAALQDAYYRAQQELNRAQHLLENHPDTDFDLYSEMFEPHPVPYPVSC